jgi:chromosome partitioning protein
MRNILKAGLRRLAPSPFLSRALGNRHATILAVAAQKGGVGKTTTSINLAAALARNHDLHVLLVDLDPQGHVATALREQIRPGGGSLSSVLSDESGTREVMDIATGTTIPRLRCTPVDPGLAVAEDLLNTRIGKEFLLRDALRCTRTHYDVIVLDCPPNLGNLSLNALVAADQVLVPCDPSPLAVKGVHSLVRTIDTVASRLNPDIDVLGVLLTRVDGRNRILNEQVTADIESDALVPIQIGISASLSKAQMHGTDIFDFDPTSRGAEQYAALAAWVAERLR